MPVDARHVAVVGHSIGGAAAVELLGRDARVDAAVDLDGDFFTEPPAAGLDRPVLLLGEQRTADPLTWAAAWERLRGWKRWLDVDGAGHLSFTDVHWYVDALGTRDQVPPEESGPVFGTMKGARADTVTRAYVGAFLDRQLRGVPSTLLDGPCPAFPEVAFLRR
ncbi:hypothetical protein [Kitasatospora sp. NPDC088346]|uniref:hypothetical protein n=1 Tax=Kitasatospora sp. NPDC088346 TaxID=3364073 RepID=UPI0037FEE2B0